MGKVCPKSHKLILQDWHATHIADISCPSHTLQSLPATGNPYNPLSPSNAAWGRGTPRTATDLNTSPRAETTGQLATLPEATRKRRCPRNQDTFSTGVEQQQILKQIFIYQKHDLAKNHYPINLMIGANKFYFRVFNPSLLAHSKLFIPTISPADRVLAKHPPLLNDKILTALLRPQILKQNVLLFPKNAFTRKSN